jgi:hypothetical protein
MLKKLSKGLALTGFVVGASVGAGCIEDASTSRDKDPPRVVAIEPATPVVAVDATFRVRFSEALLAENVSEESVVIAPRAEVTESFLSDIGNPPLSNSRLDDIEPITVTLAEDDTVLVLDPVANLNAATAYSIVISEDVRDAAGNPLVGADGLAATFQYDFTTDDGPPALVEHDVPAGQERAAPNRKRFTFIFDQPVQGLSVASLRVEPTSGGTNPAVESIEIAQDRSQAVLILADPTTGCERLTPGGTYQIALGPGITDDDGQAMVAETIPFTVGNACDTAPNQLVGEVIASGLESGAVFTWFTSKASTTELRYGTSPSDLSCLGNPCPTVGESDFSPTTCDGETCFRHAAQIDGLVVNTTYHFSVRSVDQVGLVATATGSFQTAPLPKVAINEFIADPGDGVDSTAGEFVELVNFGDEVLDLTGYAFQVSDKNPCTLGDAGAAPALGPGEFVVLGGSGFYHAFYGLNESQVYRFSGTTVCSQLANSSVPSLRLFAADGRQVSSYTEPSALKPKDGRSVERVSPELPDVESSFCYSRTDIGPTPGATNSVTSNGCE